MKKIIAIVLALLTVLCLVGCNGQKEEAKDFTEQLLKPNTLIVATSPDYEPYEFIDENNNMVGFDIEATEAIAAILAKEYDIKVEWVTMSFDTVISAVQLNQVDLGASCFTFDPERDVLFSDYYLKSSQVVVVPAGSDIKAVEDIAGKVVGAGAGTTGEKEAKNLGAQVTEMGDYAQMFEILKSDGLDAIVCDEAVGLAHANASGFVVLEEKLLDEEVSFITAKGNDLLNEKLNEVIKVFLASDEYTLLKEKYGLN